MAVTIYTKASKYHRKQTQRQQTYRVPYFNSIKCVIDITIAYRIDAYLTDEKERVREFVESLFVCVGKC